MPQLSPGITNKHSYQSINQIIALWEELVNKQEYINTLLIELRSKFKEKEYAEIKLLLFNKTHDDWVIFKNSKAELDSSEYLGFKRYKEVKASSMLESTKSYIQYLESIKDSIK